MKGLVFWTFFLLLNACGLTKDVIHSSDSRAFSSTDPVFFPYLQEFEAHAATHLGQPNFSVGDVPINFKDPENDAHDGVCLSYSNGTYEVWIRKSWWDQTDEAQRHIMIFHELGHCRLGRGHDEGFLGNGSNRIKGSIMNSIIPSSHHYGQYESEYISELFTQDKAPLIQKLSGGSGAN